MWPNPQETLDLVTFTEEILNGKLYFLCSVNELPALIYPPYFSEKSHLKLPSHLFKREDGGLGG